MSFTLNWWRDTVHELARSKGWHDTRVSEAQHVANLHGEVSELWEAYRKGELHAPCPKEIGLSNLEEELADIIIRALDMAAAFDVDADRAVSVKHAYNATRSFRHGGKLA